MKTRIGKITRHTITLLMFAMLASISIAEASDRGELLYANQCQSCHDKNVHTRKERLVNSPEQLRAWVYSWAVHNELPWGQEEIADVTAYLNQSIYHFTD